eukprot:gene7298-9943_t
MLCMLIFFFVASNLKFLFKVQSLKTSIISLHKNLNLFTQPTGKFMAATTAINEIGPKISSDSLLRSQINSYQRESSNKVVACSEVHLKGLEGTETETTVYQVTLDDSVLYPEGGGQPYDLGFVDGLQVLKVVKGSQDNQVIVELEKPLSVGDTVKCEVDWTRRYDFMQQHTAQHLFSAVADKLYQADTVGWSLGNDNVAVDLQTRDGSYLTADQINHIEYEVNDMIRKGSHVDWKIVTKNELLSHKTSNENSNNQPTEGVDLSYLRGAPKGAALELDELRMVCIEGLDLNPCGGTHLQSLSEINILKILSYEKDRQATRVRFLAGNRALSYFDECIKRESIINSKLSVPSNQQISSIDKLIKDKKDSLKKFDLFSEELSIMLGNSLSDNIMRQLQSSESSLSSSSSPVLIAHHRSSSDLKFLIKCGEVIISSVHPSVSSNIIIYLSGDDLLPSTPPLPSFLENNSISSNNNNNNKNNKKQGNKNDTKVPPSAATVASGAVPGPFILFCNDKEMIEKIKPSLFSLIDGRGGGRPGRMQGFANDINKIPEIKALIHSIFN